MIWEVGQDCLLEPTIHADGSSHVRPPGATDTNQRYYTPLTICKCHT